MAVTETLRALGSWSVAFKSTIPDHIWKEIDYYGHIAIHVGSRPGALDDSLLKSARYVGPLTGITDDEGRRSISGAGMALWLGDAEGKGDIFTTPLVLDGDFDDVIRASLPASGSITEGTLFNIGQTFANTFQFQTPRDVIDYICQTLGAAWRVNGDGTLDAGLESDLFVVAPDCILVRKPVPKSVASADDMFLHGLSGTAQTSRDVEDYTTGVVLLAQGINGQFASAEVDTPSIEIPFVDVHGNVVKFRRIVSESDTDTDNAEARAQLQLNRFKSTRDALTLSSKNYDIKGTAQVGDYIWVYDPFMDLHDFANEVMFRGERTNPIKLRLTEVTWPITPAMSVLYRPGNGEWLDLTPHVVPEAGETALVVGGYNRSLSEGGGSPFPVTPPEADLSVPDVVTWNEPFRQGSYQSPSTGNTRAEVILDWNKPDNTDASAFIDGSHYEIRYRQSTTPLYPITWDQLENSDPGGLTWDEWEATGATWDNPLLFPETEWQTAIAPIDTEQFRLQELLPSMPYEAQIRAVDSARPANYGAWSDLAVWQTINDNIAPATPAAPSIAANPISVQMTHNLGRADGGTFNLDRDLHHLVLHQGLDPTFTPVNSTLIGRVLANYGMIIGSIPVVQTFPIDETTARFYKVVAVDEAGNESLPSPAVQQTANLITDQYISSLTASKITAGTMSAAVIIGGSIATASSLSNPRVEMRSSGIFGTNAAGVQQLEWQSSTGKLIVNGDGGIEINDGRLVVRNSSGNVIVELGECADGRHGLQVYKDNGTRVARIGELASGSEGIESISDTGELVRVDTLAFGTEAASITTPESLTGGYGDLATVGPLVNVVVGNSRRCIVLLSGGIQQNGSQMNGSIGFDMAGPGGYTRFANVFESQWCFMTADNLGSVLSFTKSILVSGLPSAGTYTVAMKYWTGPGLNHTFRDRHLIVIPF